MNDKLHEMGYSDHDQRLAALRAEGSLTTTFLQEKGWFEHLADGTPTDGLPYDRAGSDIDTTNPEAAQWYWDTIRDNILSKGFDALWADETEPDLPPNGSYFLLARAREYFNVYPLFHTAALYDGFRRDTESPRPDSLPRRLSRRRSATARIVWSSDIFPTWDTLKRQIPTGLDFAASGLTYWSNDTGGWQYLPRVHHPEHPPLLDPSDARDNVGGYDDYPELYTRWFEYATFLPIMRTHGSRKYNEVWSYGKQAEPILEKYLKLRYRADAVHLFAGLLHARDRRAVHARAVHGFSRRSQGRRILATSTCSARRSWWLRSPSRARRRKRSICPRARTGTTTGPTSACTAGRR